mmetsp:Transcript_27222/g.88952  ORF Transcript_27222/g.88952 Transcript_27222/m.88952 type:complete len:345 (-) Transcript_27222:9-1043(-)
MKAKTEHDREKKSKNKNSEGRGSNISPRDQLQVLCGPFRTLCSPRDSQEYLSFLSSFCNVYKNKGDESDFSSVGAPEAAAMVKNISSRLGSTSAGILAKELQVVFILCRSDAHKVLFVEHRALEETIAALHRFAAHPDVLIQGFKALINMGKNDRAKSIIGAQGAPAVIVQAMQDFKDLAEVQQVGTWCLGSIVVVHMENKHIAGEANAPEAILEVMKAFPGNIELQQVSLWALGSLCANFPSNGVRIGRKGGISLIIQAMKVFADIPSIQEMGCWALANLAACGGKVAEKIESKDGPQAIMAAMRTHEKQQNLQYAGLVALAHLGSPAAIQKFLALPAFAYFQ